MLDPDLVAAVMLVESGGQPNVVSRAGARGLLQVMPFHSCVSFEPEQNVLCGVHILTGYIQVSDNDIRAGLAAYNAGITGRDVYGRGWEYADLVLATRSRYGTSQTEEIEES